MGVTAAGHFGYGIKITDYSEQVLEGYYGFDEFLEDKYPLLDDGWAGNFSGDEMEQWVFVKSTLITKYDYKIIAIDPAKLWVPDEELAELNRFIRETTLTVGEPQWVVLFSLG